MRHLSFFALATVLLVSLAGCTSASLAEAYGEPSVTDWSYFRAPAERVVDATREVLDRRNVTVEGISDQDDGSTVLFLSSPMPGADVTQIRIQPYSSPDDDFEARVQLYPLGQRLPVQLEQRIARQM